MNSILIILPYGNLNKNEERDKQLTIIKNHLLNLVVQKKRIKYFIMISEQIKPKKYFNRGILINIAVKYFKENFGTPNSIIFHDIDILPNNTMFKHYNKKEKSYSIIPIKSKTHRKIYSYKLFTGSAVYMTDFITFKNANGFPNNFWGWGGEDNALHNRYKKNNIGLKYNYDIYADYESLDKQRKSHRDKMNYLKKNKLRNMTVWEELEKDKSNWKNNGYNQLIEGNQYNIENEYIEELNSYSTTIHIMIKLT